MNHMRTLLTLLVSAVLCAAVANGQTGTPARPDSQTTNAALREKAFEVIDSVASQIGTLQSAENRARFGSNIAEALWQRDEKRARALFVSIEEDINSGLRNAEGDEQSKAATRTVFQQLRINTVERIAKHDPELALSFLKATEFIEDRPRTPGYINYERNLALSVARKLAPDNPDLALKLGRESLDEGFSNELLLLFKKLNIKHREQATALYGDIISKLKSVDLLRDPGAFYFSRGLVQSLAPPAVDEQSFRQLRNVFTASAMAHGCRNKMSEEDENGWFCPEILSLVAQMEKTGPARAAASEQSEEQNWEWVRDAYEEVGEASENGTIDELLALATKYPPMADEVYWRALLKAQASGDVERAKKIAADYDREPEIKRRMLKQVERDQAFASINEQKLAQLQTALDALPGPWERISLLMSVASQVGGNDRKTALKLLDQANGMADSLKPGRAQAEAQMALAIMYCAEKSDRGLAIMESLIPKLNELVTAAAKLDGYDYWNLRDGEWNMSNQGSVGSVLTALAQNARYFAWCDFERAVSLTMQFERPEIRLMAQLKLAQGILSGPPPRIRREPPPSFDDAQ